LLFQEQPGLQMAELDFFLVAARVFVGPLERANQETGVLLRVRALGVGPTVLPGRDGKVNHRLRRLPQRRTQLERIDRRLLRNIQGRAVFEPDAARQEPQ
jgi:hypothetical protein